MVINKNKNRRYSFLKLYNPQKEGIGLYDVHYINAYKKLQKENHRRQKATIRRDVA